MISAQSRESRFIQQQVANTSLKNFVSRVLQKSNSNTCTCLFNPSERSPVSSDAASTIDTTGGHIDDITLNEIRSGCDFSSTKNIVAQSGGDLEGGLMTVDSIKVTSLQPTGEPNQYQGNLTLTYDGGVRAIRPLSLPLILMVDPNAGTSLARPVSSCWAAFEDDCYHAEKSNSFDPNVEDTAGRTLVGCGRNTLGGARTTTLGFKAGANNTAPDNTFIGYQSGAENTTTSGNTFVGHQSGQRNQGSSNTFIGYEAGQGSSSIGDTNEGKDNTFVGYRSGQRNQGNRNVFIGHETGKDNESGEGNTFMGHGAGSANTSGSRNIFIGAMAGNVITVGHGNIFIGHSAGADLHPSTSNTFIVGNPTNPSWLKGEIGTDSLLLNGKPISSGPPSSRVLKKNIELFTDYDKALEDILNTPLFTYEYKHALQHPDKSRMGIISEELPDHLQLQREGKPSFPDWPSIYGSFWASIKALYKKLIDFKEELFTKIQSLHSHLSHLKKNQEESLEKLQGIESELTATKEELLTTQKELAEQRTRFSQAHKELEQTKDEIEETKKDLQKQLTEIMNKLPAS